VKLWKVPDDDEDSSNAGVKGETDSISSFYTLNYHHDYVRAMAYS
jgi:hypothetical protein